METVPEKDSDWDFESVVQLDEVERVGVRPHFLGLQESYRVKRGKVPSAFSEAVELADEVVKQVGETGAQDVNDAALVTQSAVETEVMSLSADLKKACLEAVSAKEELDALRAITELVFTELDVTSANVREER